MVLRFITPAARRRSRVSRTDLVLGLLNDIQVVILHRPTIALRLLAFTAGFWEHFAAIAVRKSRMH